MPVTLGEDGLVSSGGMPSRWVRETEGLQDNSLGCVLSFLIFLFIISSLILFFNLIIPFLIRVGQLTC